MKNCFYLIIALTGLLSCKGSKKECDLPDNYINHLENSPNYLFESIKNEKSIFWEYYADKANELDDGIKYLLSKIDENKLITADMLDKNSSLMDLSKTLPKDFNELPKNYKKLLVITYKYDKINEIEELCLQSGLHYFGAYIKVNALADTINKGEVYKATLKPAPSTFRDSFFVFIDSKKQFIGLDSLGRVSFSKVEKTSGLKLYKGYYRNTLLTDFKIPFEIKYYVKE